ncbi:hypothetical protein MPTK1_4g12390 [Marchantia polymorpha subsp. ruderalis]|uniref:Uncharacterized protein n=2 Tax=Marchantia polymorpha TaxID=3197 RepID=A0AAF6B955_MARPO|nr:hypothetical protein MARPO_0174s0001 [Marchantia polymorpha]BBN08539.1 hypothetical protein Mp_4g12390 [Marchantia polymorpha subsp. ruderalis]|eukprot:PTQ28066.1 hypothetical protein MARPO_0174s0001 [Marchantia polymorpha]
MGSPEAPAAPATHDRDRGLRRSCHDRNHAKVRRSSGPGPPAARSVSGMTAGPRNRDRGAADLGDLTAEDEIRSRPRGRHDPVPGVRPGVCASCDEWDVEDGTTLKKSAGPDADSYLEAESSSLARSCCCCARRRGREGGGGGGGAAGETTTTTKGQRARRRQ